MTLSLGSVGWEELRSSFDEQVDINGWLMYKLRDCREHYHYFKRVCRSKGNGAWRGPKIGRRPAPRSRPWDIDQGDYYFYNVLCIERKDGIAYRRAAGRVAKEIWESSGSEKVKVILG